jgi:hypothetical protein
MGFHNFFGQKIIFGGPVADPVKIRGPGFLLDSLDFYWIFTGFSLDFHWWEKFFLPKHFSRGEKRFDTQKKKKTSKKRQKKKSLDNP